MPYPFEFQLLAEDWDHFSMLMDNAAARIPALAHTGIKKFYNGPESFTPDNQFILGEAPECRNFFVGAASTRSASPRLGGAGRALAEWILTGDPGLDMTANDIRRFARFNGNNRWLHDRVGEVLGLHYAIPWPNRELATARPFRRSPVHHLLARGRTPVSAAGWAGSGRTSSPRRARRRSSSTPGARRTGCPGWPPSSAPPAPAVAVFDQTSFSKYLLTGPGSEQALQWLCTADVAVPPGRTVYTGMLNERGTYESDLTVTRLSADEFLLVSSAATTERDQGPHCQTDSPGAHASLVDVTSAYAVFGVMGPGSRDLLGVAVGRATSSDDGFPFGTSREIDLGYYTVRATRITYVGELGWELYVPAEFAVGVYQDLDGRGCRVRPGQRLATTPSSRCGWRRATGPSGGS